VSLHLPLQTGVVPLAKREHGKRRGINRRQASSYMLSCRRSAMHPEQSSLIIEAKPSRSMQSSHMMPIKHSMFMVIGGTLMRKLR
jgi:hypothetical protein